MMELRESTADFDSPTAASGPGPGSAERAGSAGNAAPGDGGRGGAGRAESRKRRRSLIRWLRLPVVLAIVFAIMAWTGCAERLFYFPQRGTPAPPPGAEEIWFEASDGVRLHGWFLAANTAGVEAAAGGLHDSTAPAEDLEASPPTARATILVAHGNAGNIENHLGFVSFLPAHGFNVLIFDYRGYGNSDQAPINRDCLLLDMLAALDAARARPEVDRGRIGLYAQSLGAVFGLAAMAERPEIKAAVIVSPFTRWRDIVATTLGGEPPGFISRAIASTCIRSGLDPIDSVAAITDRPILIIHGLDDEIVPHEHGERMAEAGGANVRLRLVKGADHNSIRFLDPDFDRSIIDFYREAFPAQTSDGGH